MIRILPATPDAIAEIAADIRPVDAAEMRGFLGMGVAEGLSFMASRAHGAWVVELDGKPVVFFGFVVTSMLHKVASPFMIATNSVQKRQYHFARHSKVVMEYFSGKYLVNYVSAGNDMAIKWLGWLGFYVAPPESFAGSFMVRRFSKDCR